MYHFLKRPISAALINFRFWLSASNNPFFIGFYKYFYKPKPGSLNDFLNQYSLSKKGNMQVIQIGANDGITHDPIHKFIKRDRWQGVLLEPQSSVYQNKLSKIYKKNKGIHTLCAAIGEKDGQQTLYKIGFSEMRWATGLASFNLDNVEKAYENGLVRDRCQRHGLTIPDDPKARISSEQVEVISPRSIFARYPVQQFDLLQIDTEGFDYEVIRIFDIAQSQPKAIIYENIHLSEKDRAACHQLFKENDYAFKIFGPNTLAMKRPTAAFEKFFE